MAFFEQSQNPNEFFSVSTDVMALRKVRNRMELLLIRRKNDPYRGYWALPGGFVERTEDTESAARREFLEETGIRVRWLREFGSFSDPERDPRGRVLTVSYFTLVSSRVVGKAGDDAGELKWFSMTSLPRLAFDHRKMVRKGFTAFRRMG